MIVEDDAQMREFFAGSVRACASLTLAGSAGTVAEARAWLDEPSHALDVLLTDLGLPDGSGLEVIRHAMARNPACEALVISMFGDEENVLASIEAGALGYIHKDTTPRDIAHTNIEMKKGASPISPMIARRVLAKYRDLRESASALSESHVRKVRAEPPAVSLPSGGRALSAREQEVLELIARGFSYADIARLKTVSVHTVQTHIKHLYGKLAVRSKNEAVYEATQLGLLQPPARV
jgi:DNA-binding NarL/FixJ family response regulator